MKTNLLVVSIAVATGISGSVHAEGIAVTPNLNIPSGVGADVTYRLSPRFNVRAGVSVPYSAEAKDIEYGDVKYDITVKAGGLNVLLDWHPFSGNFHVSGGVITVRDPWTLRAVPVSSQTINGIAYAAEDVGALTGEIEFGNVIAPTLLVGWGNSVRPNKKWGVVFDLGFAYVGELDFRLRASGPLASDPAFRSDLEAEQREHSADSLLMPVVKFGVSYQF